MMKIKNIYYIGVALLLAGCSNETELIKSDTLSGGEKTPLQVAVSLDTDNGLTRASGNVFKENDVLLAYIRHIDNTNASAITDYNSITADQAPRLVTFTKGDDDMDDANTSDAIKETTDLTVSYTSTSNSTISKLYWDDFSQSDDTPSDGYGDKDLRTANHGLQSYYGYCYNGGTPTTTLVPETGVLGWTVATDQSASATTVQNQDLLWSPAQTAVSFNHNDTQNSDHNTLTIPYTHAMSEITVTVKALTTGGFTQAARLKDTELTLNGMKYKTTFTAPTSGYDSDGETTSIKMFGDSYTEGESRNYTAIVAPGTKLKVGEKLLDIVNVEDNDYTLKITSAMVATSTAWGEGHTVQQESSLDYILTQPGYNYHLEVTVEKAAIDARATLANWITVNASGTGDIQLDDDATNLITIDDALPEGKNNVAIETIDKNDFKDGATFSLFTLQSLSNNAEANNRTNDTYEFATIPKFKDNADDANDEWVNNPELYWPNKTDSYYFRALAKFNSLDESKNNISSIGNRTASPVEKGTSVSQGTVAEGKDILWGTTAKHKGKTNTYERGQAIPPRKGGVPIAFDHAMSKITFNLTTTDDTEINANNAKVDLTGATITVSGVYIAGTISIETGAITATGSTGSTPALAQGAEYCVIPQDFGSYTDDAMVTITLQDGTIYKVKLEDCIDSSTASNADPTEITVWERGKHYNYTIHLEKEKITFRVLIKDWEEKTGSGNANLEWD